MRREGHNKEIATHRNDEVYREEGLLEMLKMLDFLPSVKFWPNDGIVPDLQYFRNAEELYQIIHHAPDCSGCSDVRCEMIKGLIVHGIQHARAPREQNTPDVSTNRLPRKIMSLSFTYFFVPSTLITQCINCLRSEKVFSVISRGSTILHLPRVVPQKVEVEETDEPMREPVQIIDLTPQSHTVNRRPLTRKRKLTCEDKCDGDDACSPQISHIRSRQCKQKQKQLFTPSDEPITTSTFSEFLKLRKGMIPMNSMRWVCLREETISLSVAK